MFATDWGGWLAGLAFILTGARVAQRQRANPVGWLLLLTGLSAAVAELAAALADGGVAGWVGEWVWWPSYALLPLVLLRFPDGRLPSRRWRPVWWTAMAGVVLPTVFLALAALTQQGDLLATARPPTQPARALFYAVLVGVVAAVAGAAGGVTAVAARWRHARGDLREQLKWMAAAGVVAFTAIVAEAVWVPGAGLLGAVAFPVGIGVAVLRYRLYDIDPIINRSLVYAGLTATVVALYSVVVTVLGALIQRTGLEVSLVATGTVAVVFQPLRVRLQRLVNHLLYGQRDEPYAVLSQLGRQLAATVHPHAVLPSVTATIAKALKLPYVAVELPGDPGRDAPVASAGRPVADLVRLPLRYQGEQVGWLAVAPRARGETLTPADLRLLTDVARQAGVAVHAIRLTRDLQRSRERLVGTREEERRRLRRDLHDGLGPLLSGMVLQLGMVRPLLDRDPAAALAVVDQMRAAAKTAITDVRQLVYELRPPQLDELGLVGALREQAARVSSTTAGAGRPAAPAGPDGLTVTLEASAPFIELPAAVEVAAYRIAAEALTNVVRHANARHCQVRLAVDDTLELEVTDDGRGQPAGLRAGVGLTSMRERAAELGGTCTIGPAPGGGLSVRANLPVSTPP